MKVGGILETALYVSDVTRAAEFYRRVFGFPTLLESERLVDAVHEHAGNRLRFGMTLEVHELVAPRPAAPQAGGRARISAG